MEQNNVDKAYGWYAKLTDEGMEQCRVFLRDCTAKEKAELCMAINDKEYKMTFEEFINRITK